MLVKNLIYSTIIISSITILSYFGYKLSKNVRVLK